MPPPDSSDIDAALVTKLSGDSALMALMPNGVFFDQAPQGATKFVLCSLVDEVDHPIFQMRGFEEHTYLVKAVEMSTSGTNVKAAAARIDALLEQGVLVVSGYNVIAMQRIGRVRATEVDELDAAIRWQHRGGRYEIVATAVGP